MSRKNIFEKKNNLNYFWSKSYFYNPNKIYFESLIFKLIFSQLAMNIKFILNINSKCIFQMYISNTYLWI